MSKQDPSADLPSLIEDVDLGVSAALNALSAGKIDLAQTALRAILGPVRDAIEAIAEFEGAD